MSTYYTIMSMIDGFKSFINLAVMVLTIIASWIMYAKAGERRKKNRSGIHPGALHRTSYRIVKYHRFD